MSSASSCWMATTGDPQYIADKVNGQVTIIATDKKKQTYGKGDEISGKIYLQILKLFFETKLCFYFF